MPDTAVELNFFEGDSPVFHLHLAHSGKATSDK